MLTAQSDLHSVYTLTTPGVTISKLDGNAQLAVTSGTTITATNDSASGNCTTNVNTAPTANAAGSAACGSIQVNGTVTTVAFNVSAVFTQNNVVRPGSNGAGTGDGVALVVTLPEDFSDAPVTYNPTQAPSHVISDLELGAMVDQDNVNTRNATASPYADAAASGDGADEDAFATLPDVTGLAGNTYSVNVPLSGVSKTARVCGYIDFDKGGTFDVAAERACVSVAAGATTAVLTWTVPATVVLGSSYARFRIGYTAAQVQAPTGRADSGEVEDYPIVIKYARPAVSFTASTGRRPPARASCTRSTPPRAPALRSLRSPTPWSTRWHSTRPAATSSSSRRHRARPPRPSRASIPPPVHGRTTAPSRSDRRSCPACTSGRSTR